ncbi:hypothetical protein JOM56_008003 [Amanita muscaria]
MSYNFTDNTNCPTSCAITPSLNQSVPRRPEPPNLRGNPFVAAQAMPSAVPYSFRANTPPHACPPSDHQIFTTPYVPHQPLVQNCRTDMDLDSNHQQFHVAMRGDVNQQTPPLNPSFQANSGSMLLHSTTMGTLVHGIVESSLTAAYYIMPVYRVGNNHTFTGMYNPQPQPLSNDVFINNEQPSYYSEACLGEYKQPNNIRDCIQWRHCARDQRKRSRCRQSSHASVRNTL